MLLPFQESILFDYIQRHGPSPLSDTVIAAAGNLQNYLCLGMAIWVFQGITDVMPHTRWPARQINLAPQDLYVLSICLRLCDAERLLSAERLPAEVKPLAASALRRSAPSRTCHAHTWDTRRLLSIRSSVHITWQRFVCASCMALVTRCMLVMAEPKDALCST